jgi:alpha-galactosidase
LITTNNTVIWSAKPEDGKGHYLAIFNRSEAAKDIALEWNELGLTAGKGYGLRDLWEHKDLGSARSLKLKLQPHACVLYRASE